MELRDLDFFISVAENASFSIAAEENHISQSSVSKAINRLETELDVKLFNRMHHSIALTPAGQCLYEELRELMPQLHQVMICMRSFSNLQTITCVTSAPAYILNFEEYIIRYSKAYPQINVQMTPHLPIVSVLSQLESGSVDFALMHLPSFPTDTFDYHILRKDELIALIPPDHPLFYANDLPVQKLQKEKILIKSPHILQLFQELTVYHSLHFHITDISSYAATRTHVIAKVSFGYGISVFWRSDVEGISLENLRAIPITGLPDMPVVLASSKKLKPKTHHLLFQQYMVNALTTAAPSVR